MITRFFRYAFFAFVLIVAQTTVARYLNIADVSPDLLAIYIAYLAVKKGQLTGTVWGFLVGLGVDLMAGSFIGLGALTKTLGGFIAGYFHEEEQNKFTLGSYRFLIVVFLSSFAQNIVYFLVFTRGSDIDLLTAIVEYGVTTTLYTTLVSLFPVMIVARKSVKVNVE
ncbi:MAG: rod shape-determining protein MreD [Ignavibacteriales bacterium]|nr:rod shape-determining protein MreD [Ignavibacteriales bacterium]